jgi:hypothetical protein
MYIYVFIHIYIYTYMFVCKYFHKYMYICIFFHIFYTYDTYIAKTEAKQIIPKKLSFPSAMIIFDGTACIKIFMYTYIYKYIYTYVYIHT